MNTRLLIARHGNTFAPGDVVRRVGITDLPLVEAGLEQGRVIGAYLKHNFYIPDVIFTSELQRTIETAKQAQITMGSSITMRTLPIFNEIDYGIDENQPESVVVERLGKEALDLWEQSAVVPNGWRVEPQAITRNWRDFSNMVEKEYTGQTILVVTSNGIARFAPHITGDFQNFSKNHKIKIATGGLCVFEKSQSSSNWECLQWNIRP